VLIFWCLFGDPDPLRQVYLADCVKRERDANRKQQKTCCAENDDHVHDVFLFPKKIGGHERVMS
jgi:hypothetical protein